MINMIKNTVMAGIVALGALGAMPTFAQAEGLYFHFGVSDGYGNIVAITAGAATIAPAALVARSTKLSGSVSVALQWKE